MSTSHRLDLKSFERMLDLYGARLERWPEELRGPARDLMEASEEVRAMWSAALRVDAVLEAAPDVLPSAELVARVAAIPARHPHVPRAAWWPFGNVFAPLLAWGAAAALGLFVGTMAIPELEAFEAEPEEESAQEEDWSELSELVLGANWALEDE
jgi:hypothetical protein